MKNEGNESSATTANSNPHKRKFYGRTEQSPFGLVWAIYEGEQAEGFRDKQPVAYFMDDALAREYVFGSLSSERCSGGCGMDFAEFPETRHSEDECPGPECTCYEVIGGHQMGCYFYGRKSTSAPPTPSEAAQLAAREIVEHLHNTEGVFARESFERVAKSVAETISRYCGTGEMK